MSELEVPVRVNVDTSYPHLDSWVGWSGFFALPHPCSYVELNGIPEGGQPEYARTPILNQPEHILTYQGATNRDVTILFRFIADGETIAGSALSGVYAQYQSNNGDDGFQKMQFALESSATADLIQSTVVAPAKWLDCLKMSFRDVNGVRHSPPPVYLYIGDLLIMRSVVTACSIVWKGPWFYTQGFAMDMLPMQADVQVTFTSVAKSVFGAGSLTDPNRQPNDRIP